jgi:hypothetical protein
MVWVYSSTAPLNPAMPENNPAQVRFNKEPTPAPDTYADFGPVFARPASAHPEVFNVVFAGGNTRAINENIEYRVYQQLMTPNGAKCVWPSDTSVTMPDAFYNADPKQQLSEADY